MSRSGRLSCATCHIPARAFAAGHEGHRAAETTAARRSLDTPSLVSLGDRTWFGSGGSSDSLPARVLFAWRNEREHALTLEEIAKRAQEVAPLPSVEGEASLAVESTAWRAANDVALFVGSLAAGVSRFDDYADNLERGVPSASFSPDEERGLRLFIGKGQCVRCHFGPTLSNGFFHNTGTVSRQGVDRVAGLAAARADGFNCIRQKSEDCAELVRARDSWENQGAIRTPALRDVSRTSPYFHDGSAATLEDVVAHYEKAPRSTVGSSEIFPVAFSMQERTDLVAFLQSLDSREAPWHHVAHRPSASKAHGNPHTKRAP